MPWIIHHVMVIFLLVCTEIKQTKCYRKLVALLNELHFLKNLSIYIYLKDNSSHHESIQVG